MRGQSTKHRAPRSTEDPKIKFQHLATDSQNRHALTWWLDFGSWILDPGTKFLDLRLRSSVFLGSRAGVFMKLSSADQNRHRLDFDQQIAPTDPCLDGGACWKRIQAEGAVKFVSNAIELFVITLDVAQVTSRADDVVPGRALTHEQFCQIMIGAPELRAEVAWVKRFAVRSDTGGAAQEQ